MLTARTFAIVGLSAFLAGCGSEARDASDAKTTATSQGDLKSRGQIVWGGTCSRCHGNPLSDAPRIGDRQAWQSRIAQGQDVLVLHALNGFTGRSGEMPPRGGNPTLSDEEVRAAVLYMVGGSQ